MKLSIIIVNWNSRDYVRACLRSLPLRGDADREVIVVDGASFDGIKEMLEIEFPAVRFIQANENIGFGACNNLGFREAKGEFVLFLNPDTEVYEDSIELLMEEVSKESGVGMAGPKLINTDGSIQKSCVRSFPNPLNRAFDSDLFERINARFPFSKISKALGSSETVSVDAVSGACMIMRSDVFRRVHGFSPEYFMYGEDMDLCKKIKKIGLSVRFVAAAIVRHHGGASSKLQVSEFSVIKMREAWETYMRIHHGAGGVATYRLLQIFSACVRLAALFPFRLGGSQFAKASFNKWRCVLRWTLTQ